MSLVRLGHEVHVIVVGADIQPDDIEPGVREAAASVNCIPLAKPEVQTLDWWKLLYSNDALTKVFFPGFWRLRDAVERILTSINPDYVWAEWIGALTVIAPSRKVIYSHHDFYYKVREVRDKVRGAKRRFIDQLRENRLKQYELMLSRKGLCTVCVSDSERQEFEALGVRNVSYIPIVSETIPPPSVQTDTGRIFVFGTWHNTAMRSSMKHFREAIWNLIEHSALPLEWHQVGTLETQQSDTWKWVQEHFVLHGFIEDLDSVFRIGDASILPYKENTGFRTRFVIAAAYGVVNIGYNETFLCAPEFTPGRNCLAGQTPQDIANLIQQYASDPALRKRLGEAARELYENEFSFEAQLPKYARVLEQATARNDH
ncbi:MAG: glycosyltransferase family 4 protein [Anaerolinea sp.]|nr:glycosyltransferase family 4 protein [Anaerolinea sp.]